MTNRIFTTCDCSDPAHTMEFVLFPDAEVPELYLSVQLNPFLGFWKRLYHGTRYILGKRSRFSWGHWDEGIINPESAEQLHGLVERYLALVREAAEKSGRRTTP